MFGLLKKKLKTINKELISKEIRNFNEKGIAEGSNVIVSLTSFPERMNEVHYALYSLLTQTFKPEKVILWLAEEQFPNKEKDIPQEVLKLQKNGLEIDWCEDIKSYKKLIPSLEKYPDKIIITTDDDVFYEKDLIERLVEAHKNNPNNIICHRAHKIKLSNGKFAPYKKWKKKYNGYKPSFLNFFTGVGGVLYPVNSLYKDITNRELFTKLAPKADDIWFWAMAVLNNTKIIVPKKHITDLKYLNPKRERGLTNQTTLFSSNKNGGNDIQLANVINQYPKILEIIDR